MLVIISIFLVILGIYFGIGILFAFYFFIKGAAKIDPLIKESSWKVRLLLLPGTLITWPFLSYKLLTSKSV